MSSLFRMYNMVNHPTLNGVFGNRSVIANTFKEFALIPQENRNQYYRYALNNLCYMFESGLLLSSNKGINLENFIKTNLHILYDLEITSFDNKPYDFLLFDLKFDIKLMNRDRRQMAHFVANKTKNNNEKNLKDGVLLKMDSMDYILFSDFEYGKLFSTHKLKMKILNDEYNYKDGKICMIDDSSGLQFYFKKQSSNKGGFYEIKTSFKPTSKDKLLSLNAILKKEIKNLSS